jgi:TonB-dependent receptor
MVTKSAFDRTGRSIEFQVGADYVELRDKFVPNFSLGFSDLFNEKTLGIRIDFNYSKGDEGFDNIDYDSRPAPAGLAANSYLGLPVGGKLVQIHEDTEYNNYMIERDRYGISSSIDYKLSDTTTLHFKPVYTLENRIEDDVRFHKIMDNRHSRDLSSSDRTAAGSAFTNAAIFNGSNLSAATFTVPGIGSAVRTGTSAAQYRTLTSLTEDGATTSTLPNGNGRGRAGYYQALNDRDIQFYSLDLGGKTLIGDGSLTYGLFNSKNRKEEESEQARVYRNGIQWAYDRTNRTQPQYNAVGTVDPYALPANQLTGVDRFTNINSSTSENTGNGILTAFQRETEEEVNQAQIDFETPFPDSTGILGKFKTGLKMRAMERSYDSNQQYYNFASTAAYNAFDFASYMVQNPNTVAGFPMPYYPDAARLLAAARAGQFGLQPHTGNSQRAASLNGDYQASEDTLAGYLMGTFDLGPKLQLTTGFRVEHNWFESETPVLDSAAYPLLNRAPNFATNENDYTVVLPGVHLRYEARQNVVFRSAYTETYGRPSFTELIGTAVLDEANNVLTIGNPELEPFMSKNYDISVEYFGASTYLQLALFQKNVTNFVTGTSATIDGPTTYDGVTLAESSTYTVNTFSNDDKATNRGVELASRYRFIHAPAPFDGFYLDGSVTYTDSYARYSDRPGERLPTYGASEWLYNAGLGFEKGRYAAQLSYRFRSPYLEGLDSIDQQNRDSGSGPDARDDWWGEQKYWNWESSVKITKNFKVYLNVTNLFEYTNVGYQSPPENGYPEDSYWHQRRWSFGVKGTF